MTDSIIENETEDEEEELCVCQEPTCPGCECGTGCEFEPGHEQGAKSLDPLQALIEAVEMHLLELNDSGSDINDHEDIDDEDVGKIWDDVRRLYATVAYAKKQK